VFFLFLPTNEITSHLLLVRRSNKGIPSATTHKLLFRRAADLSNVVALDDMNPHTLPLGMSFFRVNDSIVEGKNLRVDKFVLNVQVFSPGALDITSARLSDDKLVVILTVAGPDKFVQDARLEIAYQMAASIHPARQMEEPVSVNYLASMTAAYSKADEYQSVEDSDTNLSMKLIYCVLPPGVRGSNSYFNEGRINLNDPFQLQAFPFIHAESFDSYDLFGAGLELDSIKPSMFTSSKDALGDTASSATADTTKPELLVKVDADLEGQDPADYCLEVLNQISSQRSKGYFVCFQIAVDGTAKQHVVVANGRVERRAAKEAAFANMTQGKRSPLR